MNIATLQGTNDILFEKARVWQEVERVIRGLCGDFFIDEIRTPLFERTELFIRGVGETTDIVQKEMYTFRDQGDRSLTLKPEETACVARAFVQHGMASRALPLRLYYITPLFRAEKPQKGRERQFHQFGYECLGSQEPIADAEAVAVGYELFRRLGIKDVTVRLNTIGDSESRMIYNDALVGYINANLDRFCPLCVDRAGRNPLRVLDCKNPECGEVIKGAPKTLDHIKAECVEHFEGVKRGLSQMDVPYTVDTSIVRGLDYYTRTVFEFISGDYGSRMALGGGGRYDNLIAECGGAATPAVGFAIGLERVIIALGEQGLEDNISKRKKPVIYLGSVGERGQDTARRLARSLRSRGIAAYFDISGRGLKAQMKYADKTEADFSLIVGDNEVETGRGDVKDMKTGATVCVTFDNLPEFMEEKA